MENGNTKVKKGLTLNLMLVLFALVPLTVSLLVLGFSTAEVMKKNIEDNIREELEVSAEGLREYYEYDLINGIDLDEETGFCQYETDYIDRMNQTGIDFTLFNKNIRFMTTIKDDAGKRIEGTPASDAVWAAVSAGNDYYSDDVVITGRDYYVYYVPMGDKGNVLGMAFAGKEATDVKKAERHMYMVIIAVGVILEAVFLIVALLLAKKVADPIRHITDGIYELSQGTVNADLETSSNVSETKKLIQSAKDLSEHLRRSIGGIVGHTGELVGHGANLDSASSENADNMANLSTAVDEIANGATSMAEDVQNAAESVAEVLINLENINESVVNTQNATDVMTGDSRKVVDDFDVLIEDTRISIDKLQDISRKMEEVAKAVEDVNNAAGEINNIASQTNLLSLNASIEAARAGEAGRGFAVVAGEISNLSDQSNTAAGTIKDIMNNLEHQTREAVESVTELSEMMEKQGETSRRSQESLNQLINAIEDTKTQVASVKSGSEAVSNLCDRLNEIIQNLSAISEENAASAQETSASIEQVNTNTANIRNMAKDLNGVADDLKQLTDYFRV